MAKLGQELTARICKFIEEKMSNILGIEINGNEYVICVKIGTKTEQLSILHLTLITDTNQLVKLLPFDLSSAIEW